MNVLVAVLAFIVAAQYVIIAVFVVPRMARIAQVDRRVVATARWGATAFFIGCAITHATIALQTLDPGLPGGMDMAVSGGTSALVLEMVIPHIAQILGGAAFILIAIKRLDVSITSKQQAADQRDLDRQFRSAFDQAPLGFALWAADAESTGSVYVNPAFLDIYGLDEANTTPSVQDLLDRVHPDDRATAQHARISQVAAGAPADLQFRVLRPDGTIRWIRSRLNPVAEEGGRTTRVTTVAEDITDRVNTHAALTASEELFTQLADSVNVGISLRDLHPPRFLWANAAYVRIVGTNPSQPTSTTTDPALSLIHPDDSERVLTQYWPRAQAGEVAETEHRIIRTGGAIQWVRVVSNPVLAADGTVNRVAATVEDITVRKQAEALRGDLLRRISDSLSASTLDLDEIAQDAVDLAVAVVGDGAVLRVLSPDHLTVQKDVVAHRDPVERDRVVRVVASTATAFQPDTGIRTEVIQRGRLVSTTTAHERLADFKRDVGARVDAQVEHLIVAPVRHDGAVLGLLGVYRTDAGRPYDAGDDDLVQVLADRLGAAVATNRALQVVEAERSQTRAAADQVLALTEAQHDLYAQLATTEARERALLAEAVHDDPMQLIVSSILRLDLLRVGLSPEAGAELDQVATVLESSVEKLRHLIVALIPPDLTSGLGPALLDLAQGIFIGTPTLVSVTGLSHVDLSEEVKASAYRIVREALVNARKHAQAATVTLDLREHDDQIEIGVTDDGVGAVTLDAGRGHLGLTTMRARAETEGAYLDIRSIPGRGTAVRLTLPSDRVRRDKLAPVITLEPALAAASSKTSGALAIGAPSLPTLRPASTPADQPPV